MSAAVEVTLTYTPDEAERVVSALRYFNLNVGALGEDHDRLLLIESAIHRAIPKPKPAEPTGLGAVVEDANDQRWVKARCQEGGSAITWRSWPGGLWRTYDEVNAVRVLSEGVQ